MKNIYLLQMINIIENSKLSNESKRFWHTNILPYLNAPQMLFFVEYFSQQPNEIRLFDDYIEKISTLIRDGNVDELNSVLEKIVQEFKKKNN